MLVNRSGNLLIAFAAIFSLALLSGALAANISGTLRGMDGNPIREQMRVEVSQDFENWGGVQTANGSYSIQNLQNGGYYVRVLPVNVNSWYYQMYYPGALNQNYAEMVWLWDADAEGIDFWMSEGGRFSGSVTVIEGGNLPDDAAMIQVFDDPQAWFEPLYTIETDHASAFASEIVPPGDYLVRFVPQPDDDHVAMYYGDSPTAMAAEWITIEPRSNTARVSAVLPLGGLISGETLFDDQPVSGVASIVILADGADFSIFSFGFSDFDGTYLIHGVPEGECYIYFISPDNELCSQWYNRAYSLQTATPVRVTSGEMTHDINAEFEHGVSLTGELLKPDGSRVQQWDARLNLLHTTDPLSNNYGIDINEDGTWQTASAVPPGVYGVRVDYVADPNIAIQFFNNAVHSWEADWMYMGPGMISPPLTIRLRMGGTISGTIYDPDGQGVSDVDLSLMDEFGALNWSNTDFDGSFTMNNLPVGRYFLMATPNYQIGEIDPAIALVTTFSGNAVNRQNAEWFVVSADHNTNVDLTLVQGGVVHITATGPGGRYYDLMADAVGLLPLAFDNNGVPFWDAVSSNDGEDTPTIGEAGADMALPAGSYTIALLPVYAGSGAANAPSVRRTFLGGGFELQGAEHIDVATGQSVDAPIQVVESGYSISGRARPVDGQASFNVTAAYDANGLIVNAFMPSFTGISDPNGSYLLKGLPNGNYRLFNWPGGDDSYIIATWYPNIGDAGRQPENIEIPQNAGNVVINNGNANNIDLVLQLAEHYTGVETKPVIAPPTEFSLHGAFPNPFNSAAMVMYDLSKPAVVKLTLTDVLGRVVSVLNDGYQPAGRHVTRVDGGNLSNGVYFIRMEAAGFKAVTRITLMK